jgi:short-subunit dehydrogenase involved in D-alanine esterification of teichoic acids
LAFLSPKAIVICCRDEKKGNDACQAIKGYGYNMVEFMKLDLNDLKSVKEFSEIILKKYPKIDVLLNNAGVSNI